MEESCSRVDARRPVAIETDRAFAASVVAAAKKTLLSALLPLRRLWLRRQLLLRMRLLLLLQKRCCWFNQLLGLQKLRKTICCCFTCYCANYVASTSCCLLHCRVDHHGELPSTVRFKTTRGEDRIDGLGDLSLHGKQFIRASAHAIGQKEGICHACLTNGRNNRGRMWESTAGEEPRDGQAGSNATAATTRRRANSTQHETTQRKRTQRHADAVCARINRHRRDISARQSR